MAIDVCNICNGTAEANCLRNIIGSDNMKGMWRRAIVELLCGISGAVVPSTTNSGVYAQQTKSLANVQAASAFTDTALLDSTKIVGRVYINNTTDTDIEVSTNGGSTVAFTVPANSNGFRDFGKFKAALQTDLQYRYSSVTGAPTTGSVVFDGSY